MPSSRVTLRFGSVEDVETGAFDGPAELPRSVPDTTFAWPAGPVYTVKASGGTFTPTQFQTALNTAAAQDSATILIDPGLTINGSFTLPARSDKPGWVYIASAAVKDGTFPKAPGQRVTPSDAAFMPVIQTTSVSAGAYPFKTVADLNHSARYRLVGLCVTTQNTNLSGSTTILVGAEFDPSDVAKCTEDIGVDRCYLYAVPRVRNARVGVRLDAIRGFLVDSWIAGCYDGAGADSQAVNALGTPGPLLIHNNYLEAASENLLIGGAPASGRRPEDLTITRNHLRKPPAWQSTGLRSIKTLLEIKYGNRILLEGNVLENTWRQAWAPSTGLTIKSAGQTGDQPYHKTENVTVRYNRIHNAEAWLALSASPAASTPVTEAVSLHDNLAVSRPGPWTFDRNSMRLLNSNSGVVRAVSIRFNTVEQTANDYSTWIAASSSSGWTRPKEDTLCEIRDNLLGGPVGTTNNSLNGFLFQGIAPVAGGVVTLGNQYLAPVVERNAVFGRVPKASAGYPVSNRWSGTAWDEAAFVNPAANDYTLVPGHPWKGTAEGGRDPGADIPTLLSKTSGVVVAP